jgi:hypothetical protein
MGHSHREQEELYLVVNGSGRMKLDARSSSSANGTSSEQPPRPFALEGAEEGLEVIAIGSDRPEGGDVVPVPNWWLG